MTDHIDQTNRIVSIPRFPERIVSLVPSQTELLYHLGLENKVCGITKFCVHPQSWFRTKTRVGGTKQLKLDVIDALQPDLIIANKEENIKEQIELLAKKYPVWISDVTNLQNACYMIIQVGIITGTNEKANEIATAIQQKFAAIKNDKLLSAIYLIWQEPYMTIGGDTFISNMMQYAGLKNCFEKENRYPAITLDDIKNIAPDVLLLSSEPFPFKQHHADALQQKLPNTKIILANGEYFSWYGSRMLEAADYFIQLRKSF